MARDRRNHERNDVIGNALGVGADYGLTVMNGASAGAQRFAQFILSREGQGILARHGFAAP